MKSKKGKVKGTITIDFDLSQNPSVCVAGTDNAWNDLFFTAEALAILSLPAKEKSAISFESPDDYHDYILEMVSKALKEYPSFFKK